MYGEVISDLGLSLVAVVAKIPLQLAFQSEEALGVDARCARLHRRHETGLDDCVWRRGATPAEISTLVVFLDSDESAYATGAEFVVDGGLTSYVPAKI